MKASSITHVLVIDRAGYGWSVLWSTDGRTWINHRRNPINAAERDGAIERLRNSYTPDTVERSLTDFDGRIPQDLIVEGTRVI